MSARVLLFAVLGNLYFDCHRHCLQFIYVFHVAYATLYA